MTSTKWLRCSVSKGMFRDEAAVTYPSAGSYRKSVFVNKNCVEGSGKAGRVRVVVTERGGKTFATLPSARRDIVSVSIEDLQE